VLLNENYNPYQASDFYASSEFHEFLKKYSTTSGDDESEDGSTANTFTRQIDGWLLAAAFGAQDYESAPNMDAANTVKIISGQVLKGNVAAISFLGTLAIGLTGDVDVIRDPKKVIKIATICAELGFPRLKSAMNVGAVTPPAVTLASFMADLAEDFPIK
jgi:hypothetical protein